MRLYATNSVKYFGIKTDDKLNWKQQISDIATKLNKTNAIFSKLRNFIDRKILKSIYHAIFEPHLWYSSLVSTHISNSKTFCFAKKITDYNFWDCNAHTSPLFREFNIQIFQQTSTQSLQNLVYFFIWTLYLQYLLVQSYCTSPWH